jgi:NADH-quinone oxidoreductase subunit J
VDGLILFWIIAVVSVAAALTVVLHRHPVYSALALVVALFQVAVVFVVFQAHLIALLQVIVYAGAIVVLFLFVIMLLSLEPDVPHPGRYAMRAAAITLSVMLGIELAAASLVSRPPAEASLLPTDFGSTKMVAERLFTTHLLSFELTSVLLLVAVVGAVVMARRRA